MERREFSLQVMFRETDCINNKLMEYEGSVRIQQLYYGDIVLLEITNSRHF